MITGQSANRGETSRAMKVVSIAGTTVLACAFAFGSVLARYKMTNVRKIPPGYFFVVGDNLLNSYDSRFSEFGLVSSEELRGHPLNIYWSSENSRLGCAIH